MNRVAAFTARLVFALCAVTTVALIVFVATLGSQGMLRADRLDAAARALRGEAPVVTVEKERAAPSGSGDEKVVREMESLVAMAEARERDLKLSLERIRTEKKKTVEAKPATESVREPGMPQVPATSPAGSGFAGNLAVLKNHSPKNAASLMADWQKEEIVTYLKAMKPYEAADILAAMLAMGKRGATDYAAKAREVQAELGR